MSAQMLPSYSGTGDILGLCSSDSAIASNGTATSVLLVAIQGYATTHTGGKE